MPRTRSYWKKRKVSNYCVIVMNFQWSGQFAPCGNKSFVAVRKFSSFYCYRRAYLRTRLNFVMVVCSKVSPGCSLRLHSAYLSKDFQQVFDARSSIKSLGDAEKPPECSCMIKQCNFIGCRCSSANALNQIFPTFSFYQVDFILHGYPCSSKRVMKVQNNSFPNHQSLITKAVKAVLIKA